MLKDAIEYIVKGLVEKPEAVIIQEKQEGERYSVTIRADEKDIGKVIGKDGKTIRALRTLVNIFGPDIQEKYVDIEQ